MEYRQRLKKNVPNNYIFIFLSNLNLTHGLWMIYLAMKGMSLVQLGILEGIFHITSFLMEVPTGIIADIYGRKTSRIIGRICALVSIILLLFANSFYFFALSFIFTALSYNLESGAGEALIYDSLKELNEDKDYMKISGRQEMAYQASQIIALLLGGYLATIDYKYVFYLTMVFILITILQSLQFQEPSIKKESIESKNPFIIMKVQVTQSIKVINNNKKIGFFIIFTQIILALGTTLFFYLQNYLKNNNHDEFFIGSLFAISAVFEALASSKAYKVEKVIKEKGILLIMPIISVICIWFIALTPYPYIFYIIMMIVESLIYVAMSDYINKLIPSNNRATILSFASMIFSFFMIFIFPLIGKIGDIYSLNKAFTVLAIIGTIFVIINSLLIININKNNQ
ncbi:MAG: MFS transporter [Pleomorphochaeta sp.]